MFAETIAEKEREIVKLMAAVSRLREKLTAIHEIAQFDTIVPEWHRLQNIAATARSALDGDSNGD